MKKIKNLLSWAPTLGLAVLLAAGCSDSESLLDSAGGGVQDENAIQFSTYIGSSSNKGTRAGAYGSIDTGVLKGEGYGFGVFAYYTPVTTAGTYADFRTQNAETRRYPNFMYNEHIKYDEGTQKWVYAEVKNTKYWPNEVKNSASSADDDQNNDSSNDPATGSGDNGGNVSFFAYAPYAAEGTLATTADIDGQAVATADNNDGTKSGIISFSTNKFNGGKSDATAEDERYRYSDPYLTYKISSSNSKQVDLLWGTTGTNSVNVVGESQLGMPASDLPDYNNEGKQYGTAEEPFYYTNSASIRPAFNVNTDLTKQKTTGTVSFLFKHALAKIGGSYVGSDEVDGSDDNPGTPTNGLMVVLDIDEDGAETGGSLQDYVSKGSLETGSVAADNKYNTKVTINEITLNSEKQLTSAGKEAIENNTTFTYEDYTENLVHTGLFNLATGIWSNLDNSNPVVSRTQTIEKSQVNPSDNTTANADNNKDAVLATALTEPVGWTNNHDKASYEKLPIGVTTVPKNVYKDEAQPFVFIPGTNPVITITIDYTVRTYDAKLADAYTEVRQKITKRLYILKTIELNKQYNILMRLGLTSVKLEATVSEWDVANNSQVTGQTDGTETNENVLTYDEDVEHVYLPINVAGVKSITSSISDLNDTPAKTVTAPTESVDLGIITFEYADGTKHATDQDKDKAVFTQNFNPTGIDGAEVAINDEGHVIVTLPKNYTGVDRNATVTLQYGDDAKAYTITQQGSALQSYSITAPNNLANPYLIASNAYQRAINSVTLHYADNGLDKTFSDRSAYKTDGLTFASSDQTVAKVGSTGLVAFANQTNATATPNKVDITVTYEGQSATQTFTQDASQTAVNTAAENALPSKYTYPTGSSYTYKGSFAVTTTGDNTQVTYTPTGNASDADYLKNILDDIARYLGALWRADNGTSISSLTYNGTEYVWNTSSKELKGSNWRDANSNTLVSVLTSDFGSNNSLTPELYINGSTTAKITITQ